MMPDSYKTGKELVDDSIRDIEGNIASLNEEIELAGNKLNELNERKAAFLQKKTALLSDKQKLEAVPK